MIKYRSCTSFLLNKADILLASYCPGTSATQVRGRRRTLTPPPWIPQKENKIAKILSADERKKLECQLERNNNLSETTAITSSLKKDDKVWSPLSKRMGLIGRKIGMTPQWLTDGTRILCTLLEIPSNHVISALDPVTWYRSSVVGKRKAFTRFGPRWKVTIGAVDSSPTFYSRAYRRMFERVGVPVKDTLRSFLVTEDAVVAPGTKLDIRHFSVGQCVNVTGKSIDWGFQGVMHRWGMRGFRGSYNSTKAHRRVGTIGTRGQAKVFLGRKNAGKMGYEWQTVRGLEIVRINPVKQVMYIKGAVPGDVGEMLLIKDMIVSEKKVKNPPFPTYFITNEADSTKEANTQLLNASDVIAEDIYSPKLFNFSSPSIVFTELDEVKIAVRDRTKAKLAKVRK